MFFLKTFLNIFDIFDETVFRITLKSRLESLINNFMFRFGFSANLWDFLRWHNSIAWFQMKVGVRLKLFSVWHGRKFTTMSNSNIFKQFYVLAKKVYSTVGIIHFFNKVPIKRTEKTDIRDYWLCYCLKLLLFISNSKYLDHNSEGICS